MSGHNQKLSESNRRLVRLLLLVLFAGSGFSALVYEIVWYQLLQLVIGSTAVSLGILLATFMGGLCVGSLALPRILAIRKVHPLRVYAVVELGIGICGILVLSAMPLVDRVYVASVGHGFPAILLRAVVSSLCLLPPTVLMGASLPAIARWINTTPRGVTWLGLLYAGNTAGAMLGCLTAGFYLLRVFNMATATYVAAAVNAGGALICFALASRTAFQDAEEDRAPRPPALALADIATGQSSHWPVFITIALSGACALGAEVVWTRLFGLLLGATVYTFSIILAVFLLGLWIGSAVGAEVSRVIRPQAGIGYCQLLITLGIAWTAWLLTKALPSWPFRVMFGDPWRLFERDVLRATWAILPATLFWGASFSLALATATSRDEDAGRWTGGIYAANTGGAIVGALAFSMILIPNVGTHQSERVLIVLSVISALFVLAPLAWSSREKVGAIWLATAMVATGMVVWRIVPVPPMLVAFGRTMTTATGSEILYVGEGMNSSIAISRYYDGSVMFHVSGKVEASTLPADMKLQRMLGDLPASIHPNPRSVLVVGFGAGVTAGSFVPDPDVQRIVICEIEPLIPPVTTHYFGNENYNVLHDPRTQITYDDARHFILTTREHFDIITSDPIHPWVKGSATLYSKEYFEMVKSHLNPGGLVTQWVPLYQTDFDTVKSEFATFFDVFPNGSIWANELADQEGYDVLLLGQNEPTRIDVDALQRRLSLPRYAGMAESLRQVEIGSALDLLSTYAGQSFDLKPWLKGAEINMDRNLRLQYLAGLAVNANLQDAIYDEILDHRVFPENLFVGFNESVDALRKRIAAKDQEFRLGH